MGQRVSGRISVLYWTGAILSLVILAAWCSSIFGYVAFNYSTETCIWNIHIGRGVINCWPTSNTIGTSSSGIDLGWNSTRRLPFLFALGLRWPQEIRVRSGGGLALPLWLPWIIITIPVGWVVARRVKARRMGSARLYAERLSSQACVLISVLSYVVCMVLWVAVLNVVVNSFNWYIPGGSVGTFHLAVTMFAVLFVPYLAARYVHYRLRWQRLEDANSCGSCGYNLTGNVSGRCPECGVACDASIGPPRFGSLPEKRE